MKPLDLANHDLQLLLVVIGIITIAFLAFQAGKKER
ncbi:hypothetical protein J2X73_000700 [Novosphingobium sp. 1748]|nr:hypothetical protein [Novosphingobium sp. 1748]